MDRVPVLNHSQTCITREQIPLLCSHTLFMSGCSTGRVRQLLSSPPLCDRGCPLCRALPLLPRLPAAKELLPGRTKCSTAVFGWSGCEAKEAGRLQASQRMSRRRWRQLGSWSLCVVTPHSHDDGPFLRTADSCPRHLISELRCPQPLAVPCA